MKKIILILLLGVNSFAFSQEKLISNSDFENSNANGWLISENENAKTVVEDGFYKFTHKRDNNGWTISKVMGIDPSMDFQIEAKISHKSGVDDYGYGLFFLDRRKSKEVKYYYFYISANKYAKVWMYDQAKEESSDLMEWKTVDAVNGKDDILRIIKKGKETVFYVNDKEVYKTTKPIYGNSVGIRVDNSQTIWVDYLTVKQDREDMILAKGSDIMYTIEDMGPGINTDFDDLGPIITADEKTLYIMRLDYPKNTGNEGKADIWYSEKNNDGTWGAMKNIGPPLNNESSNFIISVSPDNNTVLLANTYKPNGEAAGSGVSISNRTSKGWEVPKSLDIEDFYNDNSQVNYCLSPDKKVLLLSLERKDSQGESDLYVSFNKGNNKYTKPLSLGTQINSFGDECSPFIATDNKTLYYSSDGKRGFGKYDVFVSRRLDDTWTNWSKPENLGPNINTAFSEMYYSMPASGEYAYIVLFNNSKKGGDIYKVKVPEAVKPNPVALIHGKVYNSKTKEPLDAEIIYTDLKLNKEAGTAISNPSTGEYQIALPYGYNYGFSANKIGFYPLSENMDLTNLDKYTELEKDLYLTPLEKGTTIRLNNIFFDFNKADLLPESYAELDKLVSILNDNSKIEIEISGHTDNVGSDDYNLKLSQDRANTVVNYLKTKGIKNSITAKGYGETKPIATNDTDEGKQLNRRVEFTISK